MSEASVRRSIARLAVAIGLLLGLSACATHEPAELARSSARSASPTEATATDDTQGERARLESSGSPDGRDVPRLDRGLHETQSLRLVRTVLEHKGSRNLDAKQREAVAYALVSAEEEHGLSVALALAMIEIESRFDPRAKGPSGSLGLMQLQPATARAVARRNGLRWKNERTLFDPAENARLGLAYLAELRGQFGTTERAVAAYNIGPGNLRKLLARRPLRPGPYLTKVYAHVDALHDEYGERP